MVRKLNDKINIESKISKLTFQMDDAKTQMKEIKELASFITNIQDRKFDIFDVTPVAEDRPQLPNQN